MLMSSIPKTKLFMKKHVNALCMFECHETGFSTDDFRLFLPTDDPFRFMNFSSDMLTLMFLPFLVPLLLPLSIFLHVSFILFFEGDVTLPQSEIVFPHSSLHLVIVGCELSEIQIYHADLG